jgi:hypothetical protein
MFITSGSCVGAQYSSAKIKFCAVQYIAEVSLGTIYYTGEFYHMASVAPQNEVSLEAFFAENLTVQRTGQSETIYRNI